MVNYLAATANYLYGWGSHWSEDEKPIYTRRMRKTKIAITGITTLITIMNLVADWYNLSHYGLRTGQNIIDNEDYDLTLYLLITLCSICTLLGLLELVAFVKQFKDARNYVTLRTQSELFEEIVSLVILLVENTCIPFVFTYFYFASNCAISAQIRSLPARLAFVASGLSAVWRMVQSFAYCCHAKYSSCRFICCQWIRYIRGLVIFASLVMCVFLITISMSISTTIKIDNYVGRIEKGASNKGVYMYQRFVTPYDIVLDNQNTESCKFFESRIKIAEASYIRSIYDKKHITKLACYDVSEFYRSLIPKKHRDLANTYDCYIIVGLSDSDFHASRLVNAGYELYHPDSNVCVSGQVDLTFDKHYDVKQSRQIDLEFLWTNISHEKLSSSYCNRDCDSDMYMYDGTRVTLNCSSSTCVSESSLADEVNIGHVSSLLIPERELMSYYPCMSTVLINRELELPLCKDKKVSYQRNETLFEYSTCKRPFIKHVPKKIRNEWEKEERGELH